MVKIAISSDNHFDLNKQNVSEVLLAQATYLQEQHVDYYIVAGDSFNDFNDTAQYMSDLQKQLGQKTQTYFILGNHDMGRNITFNQIESDLSAHYLHNKFIDIPGTNWRIIGNNGWYDYQFSAPVPEAEVAAFKHGFYYDRVIKQPMTDPQRMDLVLQQVKSQLETARFAHKQVIFVSHFVPIMDDIKFPKDKKFLQDKMKARWTLFNGMLGSPRLGKLLEQYKNVKYVYYGHAHLTIPVREKNGIIYENPSVGYGYKRRRGSEWQGETFLEAWKNKIKYLMLTP